MDDYEHANAREWEFGNQGQEGWQVAGGSKKQKGKAKQQTQPAPPQAASRSSSSRGHPARRQRNQQSARSNVPSPNGQQSQHVPSTQRGSVPTSGNAATTGTQQPTPAPTTASAAQAPRSSRPVAQPAWKGGYRRQQDRTRPRQAPKMTEKSDNSGERNWRKRERPQDIVRLPDGLPVEREDYIDLAQSNRTYVELYKDDDKAPQGSKTLGIWGEAPAVAKTKNEILARFHDANSSRKSKKHEKYFAKVASLTPELKMRAERKWIKDVERHRYRQRPLPNQAFPAIATFHWPTERYRAEEVLGHSLEALDPIRMELKCYVTFEKELDQIHVLGKTDAAREGLSRIRAVCFQIAARQFHPVELYLLDNNTPESVVLKEYQGPWALRGAERNSGPILWSPRSEGQSGQSIGLHQRSTIEARIWRPLISRIKKLQYYRGHVQMRIRLGTFLVRAYMEPKDGLYDIEMYQAMIKESQFKGQVTQELGNRAIEVDLPRILKDASEYILPYNPTEDHQDGKKPVYTVSFTFSDSTSSDAGDILLTMKFEESYNHGSSTPFHDCSSKKWTRMDRDSQDAEQILDISLQNLDSGKAWHFEICAAQSVDEGRLPDGLLDFATRVQIDPKAAHNAKRASATDISFIKPLPYLKARPKHVQEQLTYRHRIKADGGGPSPYIVELCHFQHRDLSTASLLSSGSTGTGSTVYEARWGLNVYNAAWDTKLTDNERLEIGQKVKWEGNEDDWFPPDDSGPPQAGKGFRQLLQKLRSVEGLVSAAEDEDLIGGMSVG